MVHDFFGWYSPTITKDSHHLALFCWYPPNFSLGMGVVLWSARPILDDDDELDRAFRFILLPMPQPEIHQCGQCGG